MSIHKEGRPVIIKFIIDTFAR